MKGKISLKEVQKRYGIKPSTIKRKYKGAMIPVSRGQNLVDEKMLDILIEKEQRSIFQTKNSGLLKSVISNVEKQIPKLQKEIDGIKNQNKGGAELDDSTLNLLAGKQELLNRHVKNLPKYKARAKVLREKKLLLVAPPSRE